MMPSLVQRSVELAATHLAPTDIKVAGEWSDPQAWRQPINTAYIPASDLFSTGDPGYACSLPGQWGRQAMAALESRSGAQQDAVHAAYELAKAVGVVVDPRAVAALAVEKLGREPIEDVRIDFEDGFTQRGVPQQCRDAQEDDFAERAAQVLAEWLLPDGLGAPATRGTGAESLGAPSFCGIRFKSFDPLVRERGITTLVNVLHGLHQRGVLEALYSPHSPSYNPRALRLTFPKVQDASQVDALVKVLEMLESEWGLDAVGAKIRFEIQVETPQAVIGESGVVEAARLIQASGGRCLALHYGTYDYSAFLGVDPSEQSMEHPVADLAKGILQVVSRGHGVELSDGSTNRIPVGCPEAMDRAWALHFRLVTRHLSRGIRQGWDLHPNQLITRHLATIAYFRREWELSALRLKAYLTGDTSEWMDEPATAKTLASFLRRAYACGAITEAEVATVGVTAEQLRALEATGRIGSAPPATNSASKDH